MPDSQLQPDTPPTDGLLMRGPLHLALAKVECWSCHELTEVAAIIAAAVEEFEGGKSLGAGESPEFVYGLGERDVSADLARALAALAPNYRPIYSRTMDETSWANACGHCGRLQGAFFLHMDVGADRKLSHF